MHKYHRHIVKAESVFPVISKNSIHSCVFLDDFPLVESHNLLWSSHNFCMNEKKTL